MLYIYNMSITTYSSNVETGKMSIAVACRQCPGLGQSADSYVLWYDNRPIVATSKPSLRHRDGGHLADFYVTRFGKPDRDPGGRHHLAHMSLHAMAVQDLKRFGT